MKHGNIDIVGGVNALKISADIGDINMKTTGLYLLYTVPDGRTFIPDKLIQICQDANTVSSPGIFNLGITPSDYAEFILNQGSQANVTDSFFAGPIDNSQLNLPLCTAGTEIYLNIITGSTATSHTNRFILEGILL